MKYFVIIASICIPLVIFGILILPSPNVNKSTEPFPFESWTLKYDGTRESFPTKMLGHKICNITPRCEVPIKIGLRFYDDLVEDVAERAPQSTLENFYGEKITNNTVIMGLVGTWNNDADRLKIKQLIEQIPGVSDVNFKRSVMP